MNHNILLEKWASRNVSKSFWLWIKSFLTGRTQQVNLRGILSSIQSCPSGVLQGSVISPTLFNVHINDLEDAVPNHVNIDTCKYADDCTQYQIKWNEHIDQITCKANKRLYHLRQCRKSQLPTEIGLATYTSKIRPVLEPVCMGWTPRLSTTRN